MVIEKPNSLWGWMVVLAAACIRIIVYGISNTSGVVYVVMLDVFQRSKAETSWVSSLVVATTFFVCPFSGVLVNRFGIRKVAFEGGILAAAGLITSSFSPNLFLFCMAYGVLTGIGCGMTFIPSSVAVAGYFKKRRNLAMGIASAGGGVGSIVFPPVIKILENYYTWRGMFLFIAGIGLNISVFAMFYRPVLDVSNSEDETQDINNDRDMQKNTKRKLSLRIKNKWDFLRNSGFYVLALNNLLFGFGCSIVFGHLEAYVKFELELGELSGAMLYSVIGITVVFARLGQGILGNMKKVKILHPICQYIFFYLIAGVATMFLLLKTNYVGLVFFSIAFGTGYAANGGCIIPAILIDMTGLESLSLSYGMILWVHACGLLLGAPVAGLMHDKLHSYEPVFALAAVAIILAAVIMIFPCRQVKMASRLTEVSSNKMFGGYQKEFSHDSSELKCNMKFDIYLPPQAENTKVPVVYWLSGLTCTEQNFVAKAAAQKYASEHGLIIVAPDTSFRGCNIEGENDSYDFGSGVGFYVNATEDQWKTNYRMFAYITQELPALINSNFPADPDRKSIFGHREFEHQKMADLPYDRLTPGPPFTSAGVDKFRPWQV